MGGVVATNTNDDVCLFFPSFQQLFFQYFCRHQVQPLTYVMWMLVVETPLGLRSLSFAYMVSFFFSKHGVGRIVVVTNSFHLPANF